MLDYLISGANVMCLAGCVYIAYLIVVHADLFSSHASPGHRKVKQDRAAGGRNFRNPCLDYYI